MNERDRRQRLETDAQTLAAAADVAGGYMQHELESRLIHLSRELAWRADALDCEGIAA